MTVYRAHGAGETRAMPARAAAGRSTRVAAFCRAIETAGGAALLLLVVAIAVRALQYGNPAVQVDDQFYLLTGDRLLHGALPYVDIWDRKPIGLFLLYAAIRLLGGTGIVEYQLVATAFAAATAFVIRALALRIAGPRGGVCAGLLYLFALGMFGGDAGQSPVFYNLFVASAALLVLRTAERPHFDRAAFGQGCAAMVLIGIALQVKPSVVFEGGYFGVALIVLAWRAGVAPARIAAAALLWMVLSFAPTLIAWRAYVALGHADAFEFANFGSIFLRRAESAEDVLGRLFGQGGKVIVFGLAGWTSWRAAWEAPGDRHDPYRLLVGWALAAITGVLVFGSYFDHYMLPILVPVMVLAAPLLGDGRSGVRLITRSHSVRIPMMLFLSIYGLGVSAKTMLDNRRYHGTGKEVYAMADYLKPRLKDCLFVYDGEPILYHLTGSCLPTRWPFPNHLNQEREDDAIGTHALTEVERIMARRPTWVISTTTPEPGTNMQTWDYMGAVLRRDYVPERVWQIDVRYRVLYHRKPAASL